MGEFCYAFHGYVCCGFERTFGACACVVCVRRAIVLNSQVLARRIRASFLLKPKIRRLLFRLFTRPRKRCEAFDASVEYTLPLSR